MRRRSIPIETIIELHQRLERLPNRSSARRSLILETAELYGVSPETVYRALRQHRLPHSVRRADYGQPRVMPKPNLLRFHSYRSFKKTNTQKRADRIEALAQQLSLPSSAIGKVELPVVGENVIPFPVRSFVDPDPFEELTFKNTIEAKKAIAYYLVKPLAKLTPEQMATVESILEKTLKKEEVMSQIKDYFRVFS